jgi:3-dehydroquinate synthase
MSQTEIKIKDKNINYSIFIGNKILKILPKKILATCPRARKIALIIDSNVPNKYVYNLKKILKKYETHFFKIKTSEKLKTLPNAAKLVEKCLEKNFNRSDIVIAVGGGIIGDFSAFVASIIKRGVNFINIPTTLLAQVDSSIGGKTGVNSILGKNLIGTFYQPKIVISDISFLNSLPKREMVCGYGEVLKHALIQDLNFFNWLQNNSKKILINKNLVAIKKAIYRSCKIKLHFVNKDVGEKNYRMILNFGHTFAHAIEAKNNFSKNINHGEAVLMGMMIAIKLSFFKKLCSYETLLKVIRIYEANNINYDLKKFFSKYEYKKIINFMTNDKKNNDQKINLILLKKIGKTTTPGTHKMSSKELYKIIGKII